MNWSVVERSLDIYGYYWNYHEQHVQQRVKVYTSIDKPLICSVLQTEVHSNFLPDYVCKIVLTLHEQVVCFIFSASLGCYWLP